MHATQQGSLPPIIGELATACTRYVKQVLDMDLDYTPDTLPILDHYLEDCGRVLRDDPSGDRHAQISTLVVPAAGAYFGEVVRRLYPEAEWLIPDDNFADYKLKFQKIVLSFNPLGIALEAINQREESGWGAHYQLNTTETEMVAQALDRVAAVRPEDYFRLTIRFEVLQQLIVWLTREPVVP
ncbi:MAG: hypothetical protein H6714_02640 [Myxococcales bacterium]|nr:hypothetical protein [Myxococcales bacterium]